MMFDDLYKIDWAHICQAHGDSHEVPTAIEGLISPDPEVQESSYWRLDNHIVLQADLHEAAFYVVPFLAEILKAGLRPGRKYVYRLLIEIANGSAPDDRTCHYDGTEMPLTQACRASIGESVNLYLDELSTRDRDLRIEVLDLLASLQVHRDRILSHLTAMKARGEFDQIDNELGEAISMMKDG
ncbi:hypothetical protein [Denitrobaculum tricleocarpae]|uniref:Uncharacterized protein n=1 Tax=Denitrobaculum tricleocarpae TaxID=2591009 RepID=A0A545SSY4_9PROT|nr:hypothetical protein [Denitrobaculum tricleocarpae]TQV68069.1 hypothetical protein FKG95_29265 [Denitrobaculum tricleocarpae]